MSAMTCAPWRSPPTATMPESAPSRMHLSAVPASGSAQPCASMSTNPASAFTSNIVPMSFGFPFDPSDLLVFGKRTGTAFGTGLRFAQPGSGSELHAASEPQSAAVRTKRAKEKIIAANVAQIPCEGSMPSVCAMALRLGPETPPRASALPAAARFRLASRGRCASVST